MYTHTHTHTHTHTYIYTHTEKEREPCSKKLEHVQSSQTHKDNV